MKEELLIDTLKDYCNIASKIYLYCSNENNTRYVNFAFQINGKNFKKNEADKLLGLSIESSITKQKKYLDILQTQFEQLISDYYKENNKTISELKIIFDIKTNTNSVSINTENVYAGSNVFTTTIFDSWFNSQK